VTLVADGWKTGKAMIIVGCHLTMIDFQGPVGGVDLIRIDDGELRYPSHVLVPHQVAVVHVRRQRIPYGGNLIGAKRRPGAPVMRPGAHVSSWTGWPHGGCRIRSGTRR
jgi:hypothetical protein